MLKVKQLSVLYNNMNSLPDKRRRLLSISDDPPFLEALQKEV